jgi:hypothetical protein
MRYTARKPLQFGLRSLLGLVIGSAILLAALQNLGITFAAIVLAIMVLVFAGARVKDRIWGLVAWNWAAAFAFPLQLHWSYAWTLPLFGVVPGLPDDFVIRTVEVAGITTVIIGSALAVGCLILGTFVQKVVSLPPAMLLLLFLYSFVVSVVL